MTEAAEYRQDGALVNLLSGMGVSSKDRSVATAISSKPWLVEAELEALYRHGIPRRYVDAIADEILRHKTTIKINDENADSSELVSRVEEFLKYTQFHHALAEVIKLQRLYGGAGLVMLVDDGLPPEEPVDKKRIRAIRGFVALSRHALIPEDFTITDYSKPSHYRITTSQKLSPEQTGSYVNIRIHSSRVARFDGLYLPWNDRVRNTGWGQSVLQLIWESYKRYETAMSGLETMTSDSDMFVHKIPGLFNRIAAGNETDLRKRLEANNLSRSIYGGMVVDVEEDLQFLNRALSNIASATDPFVKDLQAATGWPASILMGDSPGGLGKEGRFEERVWVSLVEQWQEVYCRAPVTEVMELVLLSKEGPTRGRMPQSWHVEFPSIFTETDQERAALRTQIAGVDSQYINLGVLTAMEVREARFGGTEYSIETALDADISEVMAQQLAMQFESTAMGYQAQARGFAEDQEGPAAEAAPEETEEASAEPENETKTDAIEVYETNRFRIQVTHKQGDFKAGYLLTPDNQRADSSTRAPLMVCGPNRTTKKIYRAQINVDGALVPGPYITGVGQTRSAQRAMRVLFPRHNVVGLSPLSEGEVEAIRTSWEQY